MRTKANFRDGRWVVQFEGNVNLLSIQLVRKYAHSSAAELGFMGRRFATRKEGERFPEGLPGCEEFAAFRRGDFISYTFACSYKILGLAALMRC